MRKYSFFAVNSQIYHIHVNCKMHEKANFAHKSNSK